MKIKDMPDIGTRINLVINNRLLLQSFLPYFRLYLEYTVYSEFEQERYSGYSQQ